MDARTHVTSWGIKVKAETYRDAGDEQRQHHPNIPPLHPPAVIWRREWEARQSLLLRRRAIPSTCNSAMRGRGRGRKKKRNRGGGDAVVVGGGGRAGGKEGMEGIARLSPKYLQFAYSTSYTLNFLEGVVPLSQYVRKQRLTIHMLAHLPSHPPWP